MKVYSLTTSIAVLLVSAAKAISMHSLGGRAPVGIGFACKPLVIASSGRGGEAALKSFDAAKPPPPRANFMSSIIKNLKIVSNGARGAVENFKKANALRKQRKQLGQQSWSYSDFSFMEEMGIDRKKMFRMMVMVPISPEFFFYSYLVFPVLGGNNPWGWRGLPSSFDDAYNQQQRHETMELRRMQTVVRSLEALTGAWVDEASTEKREVRQAQVQRIQRALKQKNTAAALQELDEWLRAPCPSNTIISGGEGGSEGSGNGGKGKGKGKKGLSKKQSALYLRVGQVPGSIVKQCCRSLGVDGVPDLPLLRRMNVGELQNQLERVHRSDMFLKSRIAGAAGSKHATGGVSSMSAEEVRAACFERCIPTRNRSEKAMRADLGEWLHLISAPMPVTISSAHTKPKAASKAAAAGGPPGGTVGKSNVWKGLLGEKRVVMAPNFQNKRLAMMALYAAKGLRSDDFSTPYKAMLGV